MPGEDAGVGATGIPLFAAFLGARSHVEVREVVSLGLGLTSRNDNVFEVLDFDFLVLTIAIEAAKSQSIGASSL